MTADAPNNGRFEPLHDAHAIESIACGIRFDGPVDVEKLQAVFDAITARFGNELPGRSAMQSMVIPFGPTGPLPATQPPMGRAFFRARPDGSLETELRVESSVIVFRTTEYTRWATVWSTVSRYFAAVVPLFSSQVAFQGFELNYIDKFNWIGPIEGMKPAQLFKVDSPYISPHILTAPDQWHSNTGAFLRPSDDVKRLINFNVDTLDELRDSQVGRSIRVATVVTDFLNQPGFSPTAKPGTDADAMSFTSARFSALHGASKNILARALTEKMCQRIALQG